MAIGRKGKKERSKYRHLVWFVCSKTEFKAFSVCFGDENVTFEWIKYIGTRTKESLR